MSIETETAIAAAPRLACDLLSAARNWLDICAINDMGSGGAARLTDRQVVQGIERHYAGGWEQFVKDGA